MWRGTMAAQDDHEGSSQIMLSLCAGASLIKGQILFSNDSRFFCCCSGWAVKVYNTINGQCAQVLEGHSETVTGLALNPANKLQLFSCGLDGLINQWAYDEGVLLRTYSFYMPLHALMTVDSSGAYVTAIAQRPQALHCCLLRLPLKKDRKASLSQEGPVENTVKMDVLLPSCDADHRTVAHGCSGEYIAAVHGHELSVFSCKRKTVRKLKTEADNPFTCVACHPTDTCVATGHATGKITFWWNFFNKDKTVTSSSHWHSLPVQSLAFSPEGSCLLSGGHECVLVKWQMNSEHKDFLPRLGAPIHSITPSPDGAMFITSHTDNVLQVITSSFGIVHAVRGLARAHLGAELGRPMPVGLLCDPRSKALVTNGRPGHLQFYCMDSDTQLFNLDIVGQNYISPDNLQKQATVTEVEQAAFDPSGNWLATFQKWEDGVYTPEYCLKFWHYNKKQQNYQLNTTVETPHYKPVRCLQFNSGSASRSGAPTMVSTGEDGFFKLWSLIAETHLGKAVERWTCDSVGHYRNKPASVARFSSKGTSLAVVFDNVLTLWDPESNALVDKLSFDQPILYLEFGGQSCPHFIVLTTCFHLTVVDLRTLSVHMQMPMQDVVLATDGDLMCAVTNQQDLYVFRPTEDQPVLHKKNAVANPVVSALFLPPSSVREEEDLGWQTKSRLCLLDSKQMLFTPTLHRSQAQMPQSRARVQLKQVLHQTPVQALLNSRVHQNESTAPPTGDSRGFRTRSLTAALDVMNTFATTMDPFSAQCQQLLETLLVKRKGQEEPMEEEPDSEEDVATVTMAS